MRQYPCLPRQDHDIRHRWQVDRSLLDVDRLNPIYRVAVNTRTVPNETASPQFAGRISQLTNQTLFVMLIANIKWINASKRRLWCKHIVSDHSN